MCHTLLHLSPVVDYYLTNSRGLGGIVNDIKSRFRTKPENTPIGSFISVINPIKNDSHYYGLIDGWDHKEVDGWMRR